MRSQAAAKAARRKTRRGPTRPSLTPAVEPDPVRLAVDNYSPAAEPTKGAWPAISSTVRTLVLGARPKSADDAKGLLSSVARHVALRHQAGMSLTDLANLLSDRAIAATVGAQVNAHLTDSTRGTYRSHLKRVRAAVLPDLYSEDDDLAASKTPVAVWYDDAEITALFGWVEHTTQVAAPYVRAALLLGLGAGLDGLENYAITGHDVRRTPWGLVVATPGVGRGKTRPARLVPVLAQWEHQLAQAVKTAGALPLVGDRAVRRQSTSHLADAVARTDGLPRLEPARARARWTRDHLEAGVSFTALRQAGASTANCALNDFAAGLHVPGEEFVTTLRRGTTPFDASKFEDLLPAVDAS